MPQNNTTMEGAWDVTIGPTTGYTTGLVSNATYTRNANGDAYGLSWFKHAWWRYRPTASGTATISGSGTVPGSGTAVNILLFKLTGNTLNPQGYAAYNTGQQLAVTAGETYYFVMEQDSSSTTSNYWLNVVGPGTAKPVNDELANKSSVIIVNDGDTFEAAPTPVEQLTLGTPTEDATQGTLYRSAWWKITTAAAGTIVFKPRKVNNDSNAYIQIYTMNASNQLVTVVDGAAGDTVTLSNKPSGSIYYMRMVTNDNGALSMVYRLSITGPHTETEYVPPVIDNTNHQWTNATTIVPASDGSFSYQYDNSTYTATETNPTGAALNGGLGAWWTYTPTVNTALAASLSVGTSVGLQITVYSKVGNTWTILATNSSTTTNSARSVTAQFSAGVQYYIRTAAFATSGGTQALSGSLTDVAATDTTNHQMAKAYKISGDSIDTSADARLAEYAYPETETPVPTVVGDRSAYWYYQPGSTGPANFHAFSNQAPVNLSIYAKVGSSYTQIFSQTSTGAGAEAVWNGTATGGTRYLIRIARTDSTPALYRLYGNLPATFYGVVAPPVTLSVTQGLPTEKVPVSRPQPITVAVSMGGRTPDKVPPIDVTVSVGTPTLGAATVMVPPIKAGARVVAATLRRLRYGLVDPADDSTIPVYAPVLSGYVTLMEGDPDDPADFAVDFEYGTLAGSTYTVLQTVRVGFELFGNYNIVTAPVAADLSAGTYQWRVRLVINGHPGDWTDPWQFAVGNPVAAVATATVTATVVSIATYPHLWHIEPPVGAPGEQVTLIGQGFPTAQTSVLFGADELDIVSWTHVPATGNAPTGLRLIADSYIDAEHDEVVVVVPDTEEAGASVVVTAEED